MSQIWPTGGPDDTLAYGPILQTSITAIEPAHLTFHIHFVVLGTTEATRS